MGDPHHASHRQVADRDRGDQRPRADRGGSGGARRPGGRRRHRRLCFIPRDVVLEVLDAAEQKAKAEAVRCKAIDDGVPVPDIARATYGEK
jgi:hypothetical protein